MSTAKGGQEMLGGAGRSAQGRHHVLHTGWNSRISYRMLLQEFAHLRSQFWGRHLWARGYP
ncbi:MAG: hypothetical protein AABZ16_03625 [candidate division NC10 bacterium]